MRIAANCVYMPFVPDEPGEPDQWRKVTGNSPHATQSAAELAASQFRQEFRYDFPAIGRGDLRLFPHLAAWRLTAHLEYGSPFQRGRFWYRFAPYWVVTYQDPDGSTVITVAWAHPYARGQGVMRRRVPELLDLIGGRIRVEHPLSPAGAALFGHLPPRDESIWLRSTEHRTQVDSQPPFRKPDS